MNTAPVVYDSDRQSRQVAFVWRASYLLVVLSGFMIAVFARRRVAEPFLGLSLAIILVLLLGWLIRPRATLYATLFLTAVSDQVTVWWFPFAKNLSSRESIAFVADSVTVTPLQISLFGGCAISILRRYAHNKTLVAPTALTWPVLVFTLFVVYGFVRGVSSGGDLRAAVFEGRPLFHIVLVFILVVNECTASPHIRTALWATLAGVVVQSLLSVNYFNRLPVSERDTLDRLNEHGSVLGQNLLLLTFLALVLLRVRAGPLKWALLLGLVPTVYVFFLGQRRAGVAALAVGALLLAVALYWRRPKVFWSVAPIAALLMALYVAAFWTSQSTIAFPARAIKPLIAPGSANLEDQSSDIYRWIEAYNLNYTIRTDPLKGIGFGRAFYRPVPLPDISVFELNDFQPHNSVLWIWMKTGFLGFVAMFYMIGMAIMTGADRVRRLPYGTDLVVTLSATLFIAMFAVYSYVDVSWDARNSAFLGLAMAICAAPVARPCADEPQDVAHVDQGSMTDAIRSA